MQYLRYPLNQRLVPEAGKEATEKRVNNRIVCEGEWSGHQSSFSPIFHIFISPCLYSVSSAIRRLASRQHIIPHHTTSSIDHPNMGEPQVMTPKTRKNATREPHRLVTTSETIPNERFMVRGVTDRYKQIGRESTSSERAPRLNH